MSALPAACGDEVPDLERRFGALRSLVHATELSVDFKLIGAGGLALGGSLERGDGLVGCSEIDECAEGSDDCAPQAI